MRFNLRIWSCLSLWNLPNRVYATIIVSLTSGSKIICPFHLDNLSMIPRYVTSGSFQTVCDDKSECHHILLSPDSRTFFGFQWGGFYYVSNAIPFGWKASAYIYHSTGLLATDYFRSVGIPCLLYIDDRHTGEISFAHSPGLRRYSFG